MKRFLVLALAVLLVVVSPVTTVAATTNATSTPIPTQAGAVSSKDEVIYATLQANGQVEGVYMVNVLKVVTAGQVTDYGTFHTVKNLTNTDPITQSGDTITASANAGTFYYQGDLGATALPWDVSITYTLDGKAIDSAALAGASGALTMNIKTAANKAVEATFYENYLLQISLSLDNQTCHNVVAEGGTLANAGKTKMITFTALPNKNADVTLTADVENFEFAGVDIAGIPFNMGFDIPDTSSMTSDMSQLTDAIKQLNEGVAELNTGVAELRDGAGKLQKGSTEYLKGMETIAAKKKELVGASDSILKALQQMSAAMPKQGGSTAAPASLAELPTALTQINTGLMQIRDGLLQLKTGYAQAFGALDAAMSGIPQSTLTQEQIGQLMQNNPDNAALQTLVETYTAAMKAKGTYAAVREAFAAVDGTLAQTTEALGKMSTSLTQMSSGISAAMGSGDPTAGLAQLASGLSQLSSNYGSFHSGLVGYTDGVAQLSTAYQGIHTGMSSLSSGTAELTTGVSKLHDGTDELYTETRDLPSQMQTEIDKMTSEYDVSDFTPVSFASAKNTQVGVVQFVIKAAGVTIPEPPKEIAVPETEPTFWARLLALFQK